METLQAIMSRKSIRKFKNGAVADDIIEKLILAGMQAPSAKNRQSWSFIIVKDKAKMAALVPKGAHFEALNTAAAAIVVCADTTVDEGLKYQSFIHDCSSATLNILLAAHDLGLGAAWLGVYPKPDCVKGVAEEMQIPENIDIAPFSIIALGYPDQSPDKVTRYDAAKIHYEKW